MQHDLSYPRQDKTRQDKTRQDKTRQTNYAWVKYRFVKKAFVVFLLSQLAFFTLFLKPESTFAYSTNMSASIVVGQSDFVSKNTTISQSILGGGQGLDIVNGNLIIADQGKHRVLIWSGIPTTNGASANIVLGQSDFTSSTLNSGGLSASSLSNPIGITTDGQKLIIADRNNNRVLIWNSMPSSNFAPADVVIGQADFVSNAINQTGSTTTPSANSFYRPEDVFYDGSKLFIADSKNQRVLIYNSIPTSSNASADIVLGQPDFTHNTINNGGVSAISMSSPQGLYSDGNKLYVVDTGNDRILIWNSIPTTNRQAADVVIGQPNMSSNSSNQGSTVKANTIWDPWGMFVNNGRIFVSDGSNKRVLIYNSIPTSNNASADIVLGQPDFVSSTINNGGLSSSSIYAPIQIYVYNNQLFVADEENSRILIFNNLIKQPGLTLNNSPEGRDNNQLRLKGTATVDTPYTVKNVEFSVNGGSFSGATATDGGFDETSEEYYFDFTPTSNQPKDSNGNLIDGYTVRVKSTNNNTDVTDRLFYFSPFDLHAPADNATLTTAYPSFEFSVNKQRLNMQDSLSKYQVQVRKGGSDSTANWETLIDDIPIDFRSVKNERTNKQWGVWGHLDTNNGVYETEKFYATYSDESSRIKVYSKTNAMAGTYQWKIVAVDKAGHNQEAGTRNLFVNATSTSTTNYFPLAVLNISGLGNPYLNSYNLSNIKSIYYTSSSNPIFYGIAWTNSKVTLKLTDQSCKTDCTKTYSTTANAESRYGINVPKGDLAYGKKYTTNLSVSLENKYNELPQFTLSIGGMSSSNATVRPATEVKTTEIKEGIEISPSSSPTPSPTPIQTQETKENKRCIWFVCW